MGCLTPAGTGKAAARRIDLSEPVDHRLDALMDDINERLSRIPQVLADREYAHACQLVEQTGDRLFLFGLLRRLCNRFYADDAKALRDVAPPELDNAINDVARLLVRLKSGRRY